MKRTRLDVIRRVVVAGSSAALVAMGVVAAARLLGVEDRSQIVFAVQALTLWAFLPAYAVLAAAVALRHVALAAASVVLVMLHLTWIWADLPWAGTGSPDVRSGLELTVVAANLLLDNRTPDAAAERLLRLDPDVLVLTEFAPRHAASLRRAGAESRLPHVIVGEDTGFFGSAIYSRHPITTTPSVALTGRPAAAAAIDVGGVVTTVVAVHTMQPIIGLDTLLAQLRELGDLPRSLPPPVILAGDFNATRHHRAFRSMLEGTGLRDAHQAVGRGLATTWPRGRVIPTFALLDHVLVPKTFGVRSVREVAIPGSDHLAVVASLRVPTRR